MSQKSGAVNPTQSLQEAIQQARRPFTTAAVKWKVQANPKTANKPATVVAFIDARLAGERLNAVGLNFSTKYKQVPGGLECAIQVKHPETGEILVERSDVGWSSGTNNAMALKTMYSDAFKRAAVHFGVGVSIYALPMKQLSASDGHIRIWEREVNGKKVFQAYLTDDGLNALDRHYEEWLAKVGVPQFGEPIDHGDVIDAQGDIESEDRTSEEALAAETTPEPKADAKPAEPKPAEPMKPAQVAKVIIAFGASGKSVDDLKTFLASKGVEDVPDFASLSMEDAFGKLDATVGKAMFVWLKKAAEGK